MNYLILKSGYLRLWILLSMTFFIASLTQLIYFQDFKKFLDYLILITILYIHVIGIKWVVEGFKNDK